MPLYLGAEIQYKSENISDYVCRIYANVSMIVAGYEPGFWVEAFRYLTKGN